MNDVKKSRHFQFKKPYDFPFFFKMTLQKYLFQQKHCQCYLTLSKNKHDILKFRDCITSDSEKPDTEYKQKFTFLLISANKYSLLSGIQTYFL